MVTETATLDIDLNPGAQTKFVTSKEKFPALVGGLGCGKTAAGVIRAFLYCLEHPGAHGCITEPISAMLPFPLMQAWRNWLGAYEGPQSIWTEQGRGGPNHRLEFSNGCVILLKSADAPERLVGFEIAWAWMDEAADGAGQEMAYLNLIGRLRQKGYPHWLAVTTTPSGRNWLWREWVDEKKPGHIVFQTTSWDNPHRDVDYVETTAQQYVVGTPFYRMKLLGEFCSLEGLVLAGFDPDKMIAPWPKDELFLGKIAGVDFAPQSPTAIVEAGITRSRRKWTREWLYKRECDDEAFVRACRAAMDDGVTLFVGDPSGKERIRWMNDQGIPTVKAPSNEIEDRVSAWRTPIGEGMLTMDSGSGFLVREITGLSWATARGREMDTNRFRQGDPDHAFDAGAYALMELEKMVLDWKPPEIGSW